MEKKHAPRAEVNLCWRNEGDASMIESTHLNQSDLRSWMIQRVAQRMEVSESEIDPAESLIEMRIDSLVLIELAGELAELTQQEIHAEILWEHGSIDAVARHLIGDEQETQIQHESKRPEDITSRTPMRIVRQGLGETPIVSVGDMSIAQKLCEGTSATTPVALLSLDRSFIPPYRVRPPIEMAADFAKQLTNQYPRGPYTLVGYSFGGTLAYELGCQLSEAGREVRLVLLEPTWIEPKPWKRWQAYVRRHVRKFCSQRGSQWFRHGWEYLGRLMHRSSWRFIRQWTIKQAVVNGDIPKAFRWDVRLQHIEESLAGYRPRPIDETIIIVGRREYLDEHIPWWTQLSCQSPIVVELEQAADHHSVLQGIDIELWMRIVQQWHPPSRD